MLMGIDSAHKGAYFVHKGYVFTSKRLRVTLT